MPILWAFPAAANHATPLSRPAAIAITSPADYATQLGAAFVIARFAARRELIRSKVEALASELGGKAIMPDELLDEVTALVEWPVPVAGRFEERFLDVPQEALISTMQDNQKYFALVDANGKLMPTSSPSPISKAAMSARFLPATSA